MPVAPLPNDTFTREALVLGFPVVTFERALAAGGFGPIVQLGILESAALQNEVDTLVLPKGDTGFVTVNREVVSRVQPSFAIGTFNFQADVAELVFGSTDGVAVVSNPAAVITNESVTTPIAATNLIATGTMVPLGNAEVDQTAANLTLTCATVVEVLPGNGLGTTDGDFTLAFKPLVLADVNNGTTLEFTENVRATGALVRTFTVQAGEPTGALEAQLAVGLGATSGELDLNQVVPAANELRITYTPSHNLVEDEDAASPDMLLDPRLGRIRFPNMDNFATPDGTSAVRQGQALELDYLFSQRASTTFKPFTRPSSDGRIVVQLLTSIGVNFVWTIPSASLILTDEDLTFGTDDFSTASIQVTINDAGGTDRFGTLAWSTETEANA